MSSYNKTCTGGWPLTFESSHLSVCQPEHRSQLFSVRLGDIFLYLKSLLQSFPLQVGEHRPRPRPLPLVRLWHRVFSEDGVRTYGRHQEDIMRLNKKRKERRESRGTSSLQVSHTSKKQQFPVCDITSSYMWVATWEGVLKLMLAWMPAAAAA